MVSALRGIVHHDRCVHFVMLPADGNQVFIVSDPHRSKGKANADWIAKDGLSAERAPTLPA